MGTLVTFYSYKGGVGRTMALANIAMLLAMWQKKVLVVDWDLEAPGIEHFFFQREELESLRQKPGLIDLLNELSESPAFGGHVNAWSPLLIEAPMQRRGIPIKILTAGARSEGYFGKVRKLDVTSFYQDRNGGHIIEELRRSWKSSFDFVLIDSRTGITDIGGICTIQMPDILALVFTATEQSLIGAVEVAQKAARKRQELPFERSLVPALPIPSRFDTQTEHEISREWLKRFEEALVPIYDQWMPENLDRRKFLELTKIPYKTYFSFGEKLPVLEQGTTDPTGLGYAYETVAAVLGNRLQYADLLVANRDDFIRTVRSPGRLPRLLLRDLPWGSVALIDFVGSSALRSAFEQKRMPQEAQDEIVNKYQSTLADCADRQLGELAMAKGDDFLFSFQEAEQALAFALDIQESFAIRNPIAGPLGPLRVRIAIHSSVAELGPQKLLETAYRIANHCLEGQVLISESSVKLLSTLSQATLSFVPSLPKLELNTDEEDPAPVTLFEVSRVVQVILEPDELKSLLKQDPASKSGGGFQAFLVDLQERLRDGIKLDLTVRDRERIARYAHDYKVGGWQGRLRKIFGRSLGHNLGREAS